MSIALLLAAGTAMLTACGEVLEKVPARPKQDRADPANFTLDVDPMMRGTVASETAVRGLDPVVVRGYGLVVGLAGLFAQGVTAVVGLGHVRLRVFNEWVFR